MSKFWRAVSRFRLPQGKPCKIPVISWENFYNTVLPTRISVDINALIFQSVRELDEPFTFVELMSCIKHCNPSKSPGPDLIPNSVIKCPLPHVLNQILLLFNSYYASGRLPPEFGEIEMVMLHKKGDPNLQENYRGIALVNTFTKLFTSLICNCLTQWVQCNNKLPETQAGFRKGRGCLDQIFSLSAVIQVKLRKIHKNTANCMQPFSI